LESATAPLGTRGTTGFAMSCARIAEKAWLANAKLKARTLITPSLTWMENIELPAWQFVGACPTVTKFYLFAALR
jgi:hypothetical protein